MRDILVAFEDNLADGMIITGWNVMTKEDTDKYFSDIEKVFKEDGYYNFIIGTKQVIKYYSFEVFESRFLIKKLTQEETKIICKIFKIPHGFFPDCD